MVRYVRATVEDQAKIDRFLSQFVNDYLPAQLPEYLSYRTGGVYLAYDDEEIVGTAVLALPKPHEAYLGGMRISPPRQGQGLGQAFVKFQMEEAARLGAEVVRALVSRGNTSVKAVLEDQLGFRAVDDWVVGRLTGFEAPEYPPVAAGPAWAVDHDRLLAFWRQHDQDLWAGSDPWMPHSWSQDDLWKFVELGGVALAPQGPDDAIDSLAIFRVQKEALHVHYLRSAGHTLKDLLSYLFVEARAWGVNVLRFGLSQAGADQLIAAGSGAVQDEWRGVVLQADVARVLGPS